MQPPIISKKWSLSLSKHDATEVLDCMKWGNYNAQLKAALVEELMSMSRIYIQICNPFASSRLTPTSTNETDLYDHMAVKCIVGCMVFISLTKSSKPPPLCVPVCMCVVKNVIGIALHQPFMLLFILSTIHCLIWCIKFSKLQHHPSAHTHLMTL